jgi:transposase
MKKQHSEDLKILAVKYYKTHLNKIKTCDIFECTPRSLGRWIEQYDETGYIKKSHRDYKSYKITQDQVKFIITELKKDKTMTMNDLLRMLKNKYNNLELSRMHLSRIVRDNNITLKQTRLRHEPIIRYGQPINIKNKYQIFIKK